MNNKYNVLITYAGDGDFKFVVKKIGEVEISRTKPIYIYNADIDVINSLRVLKRMLINIAIGAKPTGAYKIYNMNDFDAQAKLNQTVAMPSNVQNTISNTDISSILSSGTNGPIEIEVAEVVDAKTEEVVAKPKKTTAKKTTKKSTKKK